MSEKKNIRTQTRAKVLSLSEEERLAASSEIFAAVSESSIFRLARTIAAYISLPDEPQTPPFLNRFAAHKRLVVPRVEGCEIEFYEYSPEHLQRGAFSIAEPDDCAVHCPAEDIDLIIVPGTAFSPEGLRLGRGGGFYDRLLARPDVHAKSIGVCFDVQISESLPAEPHDRQVDAVVTEKRAFRL